MGRDRVLTRDRVLLTPFLGARRHLCATFVNAGEALGAHNVHATRTVSFFVAEEANRANTAHRVLGQLRLPISVKPMDRALTDGNRTMEYVNISGRRGNGLRENTSSKSREQQRQNFHDFHGSSY